MKTQLNIDANTLNLLPIAVVLFDNETVYYLNQKAIEVFNVPKKTLKNLEQISIYTFLNKDYHQSFKQRANLILKGQEFSTVELPFIDFKGKQIYLEAKSNAVNYKGKTVIQSVFTDISTKIKSKNELLQSQQTLELISKNANDIIYTYSYYPKPHYGYISPNVKKILGYSDKDFYKNPNFCYSIVTDVKAYQTFEKTIRVQQKNNSLKFTITTFQYKTKAGKLIWLEDSYSPIYNNDGKIKFVLGISRDITKERNYQLELEQKWINYQNLIEGSPIGIFIHKGICIYANKTAALILDEVNPTKIIGKNLIDFIVPEQQQIAKNRMQQSLKGITLNDLSYTIKTTKGNLVDVELKTVPFIYNGEMCVQTTISNTSTEKKLQEETLRAQLAEKTNAILVKAIKERNATQAKLNTIFNTSTHIIWSVDKDYNISSFNQNYSNQIQTHYKHKIENGISFKKLYKTILTAADYKLWMSKYALAFKGENILLETEKINADGTSIYREIYLNPTVDENGNVTEVVALSHNITERKTNELKAQQQTAKLKAIFENGNQLIWTLNTKHYFTSFNKNFSDAMFNVYGIRPIENAQEVYNPQKRLKNDHIHEWWIEKYNQVFKTKKSIEFTVEQTTQENKKVFRQIFIYPIIETNKSTVNEISCLSYDITELKYLQSESLKLEQKVSSVFETTSHLIWTLDKKFNLSSFNSNFTKVFFEKTHKKPTINSNLIAQISEKERNDYILYWYPLYKKAFSGEKLKFENKDVDKKGKIIYREVYLNPIKNEKNEIIEVACLAHDITENKNFEQKIINQSAKLNAIFESGNQLMWTITKDFKITSLNQNYSNAIYELYKFYPIIGKSIREISKYIKTESIETLWDDKYALAFKGIPVELTTERLLLNGKTVHRHYYLSPIKNSNGDVVEVSGLGFDVTENKINEEKIIASLKEKEILLKEVHHRVKNNMQVISSILNLQSSYVNDAYALNLLKECQNRIKSMAFIHESLYQTKNFEEVNFSDYIATLSKNLIHSYSIQANKIKLILTLDKLFLNLDTSIPCGLIINEIISNSLKYAFVDGRDGIISVNLTNVKNNVKIEIGDNGIGMPNNINIKEIKTLGLQLIDTLTDQIDGKLTIDTTKGTKFIIEFKN